MASYTGTLKELERKARESEQALATSLQCLLDASTPPSDLKIAALADRQVVATATAMLFAIIQPHASHPNIEWFVPAKHDIDYLAWKWGQRFQCWGRRRNSELIKKPVAELRATAGTKALYARYACGELRDWRRADAVARALMVVRRLIVTSVKAHRHG